MTQLQGMLDRIFNAIAKGGNITAAVYADREGNVQAWAEEFHVMKPACGHKLQDTTNEN